MTKFTDDILTEIDNECIRCGICEPQQAAEGMPVRQVGDLAHDMLKAGDITEVGPETYEFVVACSQCDACTASCPQDISCAQMVKAARQKLYHFDPDMVSDYRAYRVDYKEHVFAAIRESAGILYDDYLEKPAGEGHSEGSSIFFAGCSLSTYAENLTRKTYELLSERNLVQGMSAYCCGKLLGDLGTMEAHKEYSDGLIALLREKGVTNLVIACPNCYYELKEELAERRITDISLTALPECFHALGMRYSDEEYQSVSFHTSCPDRYDLRFAKAVKGIFESCPATVKHMQSDGLDTICCGAGGMARINAPTLAAERRTRRLKEFEATGAECLVCYCMSCVNTFLADSEAPQTKHYLELLYGIDIDWNQVALNYDKMVLEHRDMFTLPLSQSTPTFEKP